MMRPRGWRPSDASTPDNPEAGIRLQTRPDGHRHRAHAGALRWRRGSAILLLSIITLPMILILSTLLQGAQHQAEMLDVERALSAQVQSRLASFSKPLYDEFGLMALGPGSGSEAYTRLLPAGSGNPVLSQTTGDPLSDPDVLKAGILSYMRLRLPASLLDTIMDQTGIRMRQSVRSVVPSAQVSGSATGGYGSAASGKPSAGAVFLRAEASRLILAPRTAAEPEAGSSSTMRVGWVSDLIGGARDFINQARSTVTDLLSDAVYAMLDDEVKDALAQFQRFQAECVASGDGQQSVELPNLFDPEALSGFTEMLSSAMTVPGNGFYNHLALREYILATFLPAGQPTQSVTAAGSGIRLSGEHLAFRNLSGNKIKDYPGRVAGELEQILIGTRSPKTAISIIKTILIVYRAALFIGQKLMSAKDFAVYRATAAGMVAGLAALSGGAALAVPTDVVAYILLACDGLRHGFSDYGKLIKGERLGFTSRPGSPMLSFDYLMHLRVIAQLMPEYRMLERISAVVTKRHAGVLATRITVSCQFRGQSRSRTGSLVAIGSAA